MREKTFTISWYFIATFGVSSVLLACSDASSRYTQESIYLTHGDTTQNFYLATLPTKPPIGLFVLNYNENLSKEGLQYAADAGVVVIFGIPSSDYLSTLIGDSIIQNMDYMIYDATKRYHINPHKVILGGGSAAGTLAVRYAQFCMEGKSKYAIVPVGVMAMDPPLDYTRFWYEMEHAIQRNANPIAAQSGEYVINYFTDHLNGRLEDNREIYIKLSPFYYGDETGGKAALLKDMPIRLYIEPDVNWYIENRGKDYLDMNAIDCAGMINRLKLMGNKSAALICTQNKGFREDGERDPHAWSIVNEKELIDWMVKIFIDTNS